MSVRMGRSAVVLALALVAAGCGTTARPSGAAPAGRSDPVKYSQCMREHGIPKFPDPDANGGLRVDGRKLGIDPKSSTFADAEAACKSLLPTGGASDPARTAEEQKRALAYSQCMRTHGVPTFPDPTFTDNGARLDLPRGVNPDSAAFTAAEKACAAQQPGPAGGGTSADGGPTTDKEEGP
jgi:hypothetical protein